MEMQCSQGHKLEGHEIRIGGFGDEVFNLTYAGWADQWIVKDSKGSDMLRCSANETAPYLIHERSRR